ncbi:MAG: transglutaminase family protein [Thermoplasmata archaeon]|nr:transglutaminase family protein [Thermoplasmata archaeon]
MNVCPECHYMGNRGVCPHCGAEMLPYVGDSEDFDDFRRPRERRFLQRWGGAIFRASVILLILGFLWYYTGGDQQKLVELFIPHTGQVIPEETSFTLQKTVTISDTDSAVYDNHLPGNATSEYQTIVRLKADPPGTPVGDVPDHYEWRFNGIPEGQSRTIVITIRAEARSEVQKMSRKDSGTVSDIPQSVLDGYIPATRVETRTDAPTEARNGQQLWQEEAGEWTIDPLDPQVQALADRFSANRTKVYDMVKAAYDWMVSDDGSGFAYYSDRDDVRLKTCAEVLAEKRGDCDDQSVVLISILRAMGIPSWLEMGLLYNQNTREWSGHGWANAYIPRAGGGEPLIAQIDVVNSKFLVRDPFRLTDYVDNGRGDDLDEYYSVLTGGDLDVEYTSRAYSSSGQIWLDKRPIPSADPAVVILAFVLGAAVYQRRKAVS